MQHSPKFLNLVNSVMPGVKEISVEETALLAGQPGVVLIDVREDNEWLAGHAEGAVHLGKGVIERDIESLYPDTTTPLLCYCGGGYRSALVADTLQKMGYTNVQSLIGGFKAWSEAGLPTEL